MEKEKRCCGIGRAIGSFFRKHQNVWLLAAPLLLLDLAVRLFGAGKGNFTIWFYGGNLFTIFWIVFLALFCLKLGKAGRAVYWVVYAFYFLMYLTQCIYLKLTGMYFSFSLLEMAGEGSHYLLDTIRNAPKLVYVLGLVFLFVAWLCLRKVTFPEKCSPRLVALLLLGFCLLHLLMPLMLGVKSKSLKWNAFRKPRYIYEEFTDFNKCMKVCGLYEYTARSIYMTFLKPEQKISEEETAFLESVTEPQGESEPHAYTGLLEGKNLIFLQLEGMDSWLLNETDTPVLYGLLQESLQFTEHYSMYTGGGSTFNSEFAVNTGYTTPVSFVENVYNFSKNWFPHSMARLFGEQGYRVNAFHMNKGEFYSRKVNYQAWGYEEYWGLADLAAYEDEAHTLDRELFLNETFYEQMFLGEEPFVHYIITYSPHTPFTTRKDVGALLAKLYYGDQIPEISEEQCARMMAAETDYAIGLMLQALEKEGLLEDTVIVAFADHYLYTLEDKSILEDKKITTDNRINHTPFFIWSKSLTPAKIGQVTMQTNILPTVLNLFGIPYEKTWYVSEDALAPDYRGFVFFPNYDWYDGAVYRGGENKTILLDEAVTEEEILAAEQRVLEAIRKNDLILKYDYFRKMQ